MYNEISLKIILKNMAKNVKSIEPNIADLANGWLKEM
jgi:hypothetical protein